MATMQTAASMSGSARMGLLGTAVACALQMGCMMSAYLTQAAEGQLAILRSRRPLDEVVADPTTPPHVRRLLAEVPHIKSFGISQGLKATDNYQTYADLKRPAVVWVVSATEELAFEPKKWTFPLVGSVPYLGWFEKDDALRHARDLKDEGWESDVRPATAFSTLGWFEDPVLSTMIDEDADALGGLADVVLHESTHATHYVDGQTAFNESIANFVGDNMAVLWLDQRLGPDAAEKRAFLDYEARRKKRAALMHAAYERLDVLYQSNLTPTEKRVQKAIILGRLTTELGARRPINNATLFEFKSYHGGEKVLAQLFHTCGSKFPRFMRALRSIKKGSFSEPQQRQLEPVIAPLIAGGCPQG
jgi:predicted aminopeptidase